MRRRILLETDLGIAHGGASWDPFMLVYNNPRPGPDVAKQGFYSTATATECIDPNWIGRRLGAPGECWVSQVSDGGFEHDVPRGFASVPYDNAAPPVDYDLFPAIGVDSAFDRIPPLGDERSLVDPEQREMALTTTAGSDGFDEGVFTDGSIGGGNNEYYDLSGDVDLDEPEAVVPGRAAEDDGVGQLASVEPGDGGEEITVDGSDSLYG